MKDHSENIIKIIIKNRPTMSKFDAYQKFHNANGKREPTISSNLFHWLSEKIHSQ